ncbi:hypothetical protein PIIN_10008 [Serendipita indica DSM 11827]|uniref:Uncharacterized protein n=1 Tax=Serendipita indica (strain DSM 11827) TaxID=1109443 RepID=G4TXG5_SERID|nr:hypothetical protein PIIN_10008 [Serendipita indica DSM 11827]
MVVPRNVYRAVTNPRSDMSSSTETWSLTTRFPANLSKYVLNRQSVFKLMCCIREVAHLNVFKAEGYATLPALGHLSCKTDCSWQAQIQRGGYLGQDSTENGQKPAVKRQMVPATRVRPAAWSIANKVRTEDHHDVRRGTIISSERIFRWVINWILAKKSRPASCQMAPDDHLL